MLTMYLLLLLKFYSCYKLLNLNKLYTLHFVVHVNIISSNFMSRYVLLTDRMITILWCCLTEISH